MLLCIHDLYLQRRAAWCMKPAVCGELVCRWCGSVPYLASFPLNPWKGCLQSLSCYFILHAATLSVAYVVL